MSTAGRKGTSIKEGGTWRFLWIRDSAAFPLLQYSAAGILAIVLVWALAGRVHATGQNPVPLINQPLAPASTLPGSPAFTLTVNGAGFVPGSVVEWNGSARPTTFVSSTKVTAAIPAADAATAGTASVTVFNPAPGGGASNVQFFSITHPESTMTFSETDTSLSFAPSLTAAADFNGDGKLDLVVGGVTPAAGVVSVLLGNGDGTFQRSVDYAISNGPTQIVVADFNGDGKLDLAVPTAADMLGILLGSGDGTFQPPTSFSIGGAPSAMVAGDFNGDGKTDLVFTACVGQVFEHCNASVLILLGNGDGTFQPPSNYSTVFAGAGLAVGDFNGDGKLDLAVTNCSDSSSYCTGGGVAVFLGNGDGTLQSPVTYPANGAPRSIIAADFNGDGKLDLAVTTFKPPPTGSPVISVLLGKGDGTFVAPLIVSSDPNLPPQSIVAGDFNGDGKLDLGVVVSTEFVNNVAVLLGKGNGTFQAPTLSPALPLGGTTVVAGGFNGDGRLDLAEAIAGLVSEGAVQINTLAVLLQTTAVTLAPASLVFGSIAIGSAGAGTVTLDNNTNSPLDVSGLAVTGPFALTSGCGSSLPPFTNCAIGVTFKPAAAGTQTGTLTVTDNAPGSPQSVVLSGTGSDFSVSASPAMSSVTAGQEATYTVKLSPLDGFNQSIALSCSGAPSESTCSVSPASATLDGANPSAASVTVSTTARGANAGKRGGFRLLGGGRHDRMRFFLWALALAMLAAMAEYGRRARRPRLAGRLAFGIAVILVLLGASCGGGQTSSSNSGSAGTPAGSYTLTLGAASGSLSHSATVTMTVN